MSPGTIKKIDTKSISWGSLQEKRSKYHALSDPLKLLAFWKAGQGGWKGGSAKLFLYLTLVLSFHIPAHKGAHSLRESVAETGASNLQLPV